MSRATMIAAGLTLLLLHRIDHATFREANDVSVPVV